jgi:DNA-binding response OmpR family regulator
MNTEVHPTDPAAKILFADDDELFRLGLGKRLAHAGFHCDFATTADEAAALLKKNEYAALLSDINMPGNVRLELIENIPSLLEGLPVILLTGNPTVETASRSVRLRVKAYLTKPPDFDELCHLLHAAIRERHDLRALQAARNRLRDWDHDIESLQKKLREQTDAAHTATMQSYLRVTLRNLVLGLVELEDLLNDKDGTTGTEAAVQNQQLLAALHKTIAVLHKTRDHFKSKDLAELRKELELILGAK